MKIINREAPFKLVYGDKEYSIPSGEMEISNRDLAVFIVNKAKRWKMSVDKLSEHKEIEAIQTIVQTEVQKIEAPKAEEKVETQQSQEERTAKIDKQIEETEALLEKLAEAIPEKKVKNKK